MVSLRGVVERHPRRVDREARPRSRDSWMFNRRIWDESFSLDEKVTSLINYETIFVFKMIVKGGGANFLG